MLHVCEIAEELISKYCSTLKRTEQLRNLALEKYSLPYNIDRVIKIIKENNTSILKSDINSCFCAISKAFIDYSSACLNENRYINKYKKYKKLFKINTITM